MKDTRNKVWVTLAILGLVLIFTTKTANAGIIFGTLAVAALDKVLFGGAITDFLGGALGSVAGEVAEGIVGGIASLLGFIIDILGRFLFFVANATIEFAVELNSLIATDTNFVLKEGFAISLTVANLALVLGLVIIAFAVMTRAEWLVEVRRTIPKFITAALLINFSFFIATSIVIPPVNSITQSIYRAATFTGNNFRGPFQPNLNLESVLDTVLKISRTGDNEAEREKLEKLFASRESMAGGIYAALSRADQYLPAGTISTTSHKNVVYRNIDIKYEEWLGDNLLTEHDIEELRESVRLALDSGGAPYIAFLTTEEQSTLVNDIVASISLAVQTSFGCDIETLSASSVGCMEFDGIRFAYQDSELSSTDLISIKFAEVLFNGVFVFLGSFSLLGIGVMMIFRYVALTLLIILFPFAWIGWIFPKLTSAAGGKNIWTAWWSNFIRWLLFGPISMFFFLLAVKAASSIDKLTTPDNANYSASTLSLIGASVGSLATTIGLLMGGLYVANKMSITGSKLFYGTAIKAKNWVGTKIKKGAIGVTGGLARDLGQTTARYGTAPIRSGWGEKKLSQLQSIAAGRGRFLKTLAKPITRPAAGLMKAGDKTAAAMIKRAQRKFADDSGKWKMAPYKAMEMYKTLTSDTEKMAFLQVATKNGNLWELPADARKDVARFMGSGGLDGSMWKRMGQVKTYLDMTEEGMSPEYVRDLLDPNKTAFDRQQTLRNAYEGLDDATLSKVNKAWFTSSKQAKNPDGSLRYNADGTPVYSKGHHGLSADEQEKAIRDRVLFLGNERPNTLHTIGRKAGTEAQFNIARIMEDEVRVGDHGFRDRAFGWMSQEEQDNQMLWAPGRTGENNRQDALEKSDWATVSANYERHATDSAHQLGATNEQVAEEQKRINAVLAKMGKAGLMKLAKDIESAKWGGFQAMMGPGGTTQGGET